jgi:hypothetical protein
MKPGNVSIEEQRTTPLQTQHHAYVTPFPAKFLVRHSFQAVQRITHYHFRIGHLQNGDIMVNQETKFDDRHGETGFPQFGNILEAPIFRGQSLLAVLFAQCFGQNVRRRSA